MKKIFLIIICLAAALFLLPGVMGSEGWGESLEIGGTVKVAEEPEPEIQSQEDSEENGDSDQTEEDDNQDELLKVESGDDISGFKHEKIEIIEEN